MNRPQQLTVVMAIAMLSMAGGSDSTAAQGQPQSAATNSLAKIDSEAINPKSTIWLSGIGEGFRRTAHDFSVEAGFASGIVMLGSRQSHDFALLSLAYGHMLGD